METSSSMPTKQFWPIIAGSTSSTGILHMAMRHVAHNISDMVGHPFEIDDLGIETIPLNTLELLCKDPESEAVGIYLLIDGDLTGESILILCPEDAMYLVDWLLEKRPGTTQKLDDLERSALAEFGNLTLSSFLNAVADLIRKPLRLSPPNVVIDMLAIIFEAVAMSATTKSDNLLILKTTFINHESSLCLKFWIIPDLNPSSES